jgi:hypothetical protein
MTPDHKANRIQKNGYSYGKRTVTRKTSINLDKDLGEFLTRKSEETGVLFSRLINESLRNHFGLTLTP